MKCVQLLIQGYVVGVGYRSWMKMKAETLHIVGWVKNREDNAVEAVVQGEGEQVKRMIELCKKGPEVAWVEKVEVTEKPVDNNLESFTVVY